MKKTIYTLHIALLLSLATQAAYCMDENESLHDEDWISISSPRSGSSSSGSEESPTAKKFSGDYDISKMGQSYHKEDTDIATVLYNNTEQPDPLLQSLVLDDHIKKTRWYNNRSVQIATLLSAGAALACGAYWLIQK
jgi:hypothetical protein